MFAVNWNGCACDCMQADRHMKPYMLTNAMQMAGELHAKVPHMSVAVSYKTGCFWLA